MLATSREGLNIAGEQILVVPSLGLPDDATASKRPASARRCACSRIGPGPSRPTSSSMPTNRADVVAVCTRLDGVALAIELAAARIPAMSPSELARRLDRRFRLLSGGGRVAIERHQTLRAAIDWSYDLLDRARAAAAGPLVGVRGRLHADAAEAVCAGDPIDADDVFELLAGLVARSLGRRRHAGPDTRYRLLETIREYGEERLAETGETDTLRLRHAEYYTEFARRRAESPLRARTSRVGSTAGSRTRQPARGDGLRARHPEHRPRVRALLPAPAYAAAGQRDGGLRSERPARVTRCRRASRFRGRAHDVRRQRRLAARGDAQLALALCDQALAAEQRLGPIPARISN